MIRVRLYSPDPKVEPLLSAALPSDYQVFSVAAVGDLARNIGSGAADVSVLDCDLNYGPLEEQLALCEQIGDGGTPIVVMTDDLRRSTAIEFLRRGAFDCIRKPPSLVELKVAIRRAYEHEEMKRELAAMRLELAGPGCDQLIGRSAKAQAVYEMIHRVADLDVFVLINGESGTGKELVARAIHNLGTRAEEPFVAVSCGAIPETLIESELFGYEKGAFTGAAGPHAGYLEQAGAGTVLLDEVGEMSLNTQVKLLRVLQQKEFTRLGSTRPIPLKARVLFATHRDLQKMVRERAFRSDLFFRISVMRIAVPPLRDRAEDLPALARHLLAKYAAEYKKPVRHIRPAAMSLLLDYDWPGNVRELENAIQGAVIMADGDSLTRAQVIEQIPALAGDSSPEEIQDRSFDDLLREFKVGLASRVLLECEGNKTHAARRLQVSRSYLHELLRLGTEKEDSEPDKVRSIDLAKRARAGQ
jgi:DNA-binding NtrC family response regulator